MSAALRTIIDSVGAENLGTVIERLTTHFLKKTGLRILRDNAAGIIDNDSRELRADHKVGPYCQRSEQDGVVGRTLAFLKPGTSSFGLSPPHFHETIVGHRASDSDCSEGVLKINGCSALRFSNLSVGYV
jgi:hypothetical protein